MHPSLAELQLTQMTGTGTLGDAPEDVGPSGPMPGPGQEGELVLPFKTTRFLDSGDGGAGGAADDPDFWVRMESRAMAEVGGWWW
jgi:hypothetical protein